LLPFWWTRILFAGRYTPDAPSTVLASR
jgi:hypothetical protein